MGKESLKMQTLCWYETHTDRDEPENYSVSCIVVQGRQWKFAQIRSYLSSGSMIAPRQGAYEKEVMGKESLKM